MKFGFTILGLLLDFYGAFFIAKSIFIKPTDDIRKEATSFWGWNDHLLRSIFKQRYESVYGFIFIATGFIFQALGNEIKTNFLNWVDLALIFILMVISGFVYLFYLQRKFEKFSVHIQDLHQKEQKEKDIEKRLIALESTKKSSEIVEYVREQIQKNNK